ncbi:MAG: hypothetical protein MUD02_03920 [Bacteroidales bacterium]|nr:hypothetical protein [Bacteroidales bacterium]
MHERFKYKTGEELLEKAAGLGIDIPFTSDISPLLQPVTIYGRTVANRLLVQPMEGYDSLPDGSPSELTVRRYHRYASGGSGVLWYEAVAVVHKGRSNPGQLWINSGNVKAYSDLNGAVRAKARENGIDPFLVVQLTHSGRYSKPEGKPLPQAGGANPAIDRISPHILTDDELSLIQDSYIEAAKLSAAAGFDAVDLKACHGYLVVDLLAARDRKNSIYGGEEPEKRFRFLLETYDRIRSEVPGIVVTSRLNITDLYPGGFGVDSRGDIDYSEPLLLVAKLADRGVPLLNLSMGSPYHNAWVTRPFDTPLPGLAPPGEHPLAGVARMINDTAFFQKRFPGIAIAGSAYSWLRNFIPNVAAAVIRDGGAVFAGLGRSSFAYPDLPLDLIKHGKADPAKCCITCSGCTRLIRGMYHGGCVIRDREIYGEELKKLIESGK